MLGKGRRVLPRTVYEDNMKETQGKLKELWEKLEKETDPDEFTLLCEEFMRERGVKAR